MYHLEFRIELYFSRIISDLRNNQQRFTQHNMHLKCIYLFMYIFNSNFTCETNHIFAS